MTRLLSIILIGLFLSMVESGFLASMGVWGAALPFVFGVSVYLFQHYGMHDALVWIFVHGWLSALYAPDPTWLSLLPAITSIGAAWGSARYLFSNRSFYGVLACTIFSYVSFLVTEGLLRSFPKTDTMILRLFLLLLFVSGLFFFSKPIRSFFERMFRFNTLRT